MIYLNIDMMKQGPVVHRAIANEETCSKHEFILLSLLCLIWMHLVLVRLAKLHLVTFNIGHQVIRELSGAGYSFFGRWAMQSLLIPLFSRQIIIIHTVFCSMLAVSATVRLLKINSFLHLLHVRAFSCKLNIHVMRVGGGGWWPICLFITWLGNEWHHFVEIRVQHLLPPHIDVDFQTLLAEEQMDWLGTENMQSKAVIRITGFCQGVGMCRGYKVKFSWGNNSAFSKYLYTLWEMLTPDS